MHEVQSIQYNPFEMKCLKPKVNMIAQDDVCAYPCNFLIKDVFKGGYSI